MSPAKWRFERASQNVYDVTASQQGVCVDIRRCGAFDRINIQNASTSRFYNRLKVYPDLECGGAG